MKLDRAKFCEECRIEEEDFNTTGLDWNDLEEIYEHYVSIYPALEKEAEHIVSKMIDADKVHSVRRRVKKPEHVIEKIIRKGKKYVERGINVDNYTEVITDLIGVRILHLFKDEWLDIHNIITEMWHTKETPQINIRRGDINLKELQEELINMDCEIVLRDGGYRSVHYLVGTPLYKNAEILVEIQVRTVFEEAWSEIDHIIRYPYDTDNQILGEYLAIFNRIAGSADEMGLFIKKLKNSVGNKESHGRELDIKFK